MGRTSRRQTTEQVDETYVFEVRNGKLVSAVGVEDNLARRRQLGIVPGARATQRP
jgi:hypothetical protein